MNCLTYLLDLWGRGHRFRILTNQDHCIGVNNKKIFELGDTFKNDLLSGYSLNGGQKYLPLEEGLTKEIIRKTFGLTDLEYIILEDYYEYKEKM